MKDGAKEARNQYMRDWRSKNKDKLKIIQDRYWDKKAKDMKGDVKLCQ